MYEYCTSDTIFSGTPSPILGTCFLFSRDSLVGDRAENEEAVGHGLKVPDPGSNLREGRLPFPSEVIRKTPAKFVVAESHADQVSARLRPLTIDKALAAVQNGKVVDEMHVTWSGGDLQLRGLGNGLNRIQSLNLARRSGGEVLGAWVDVVAQEWHATEVDDETPLMVKEDRAALELGPRVMSCWSVSQSLPKRSLVASTYMAKGQSERARVRMASG